MEYGKGLSPKICNNDTAKPNIHNQVKEMDQVV